MKILSAILALGLITIQQAAMGADSRTMGYNKATVNPGKTTMLLAANTRKHYKKTRYSGRVFVFNPRTLKWYAYENGRLIRSGRASGGKGYCRDVKRACRTPVGHFRISRKGGANCRSSRYPLGRGGARMDYCMFFSKYYAIHGSNSVPGYNASHGCIRVHPSAARWLNRSFLHYGARVIVKSY